MKKTLGLSWDLNLGEVCHWRFSSSSEISSSIRRLHWKIWCFPTTSSFHPAYALLPSGACRGSPHFERHSIHFLNLWNLQVSRKYSGSFFVSGSLAIFTFTGLPLTIGNVLNFHLHWSPPLGMPQTFTFTDPNFHFHRPQTFTFTGLLLAMPYTFTGLLLAMPQTFIFTGFLLAMPQTFPPHRLSSKTQLEVEAITDWTLKQWRDIEQKYLG